MNENDLTEEDKKFIERYEKEKKKKKMRKLKNGFVQFVIVKLI